MFLFTYLIWHYTYGTIEMARDGARVIRATLNLFSVSHLARTLFYPWHQYIDQYPHGFNLGAFLWALSGNIIARGLGAIVRTATITIGLVFGLFVFIISAMSFFLWLILPLAIPSALMAGIILLFY